MDSLAVRKKVAPWLICCSGHGRNFKVWDWVLHKMYNSLTKFSKEKGINIFEYQLIKRQSCHHIETPQLIYSANKLTDFYMMATLAFNAVTAAFHEKH